MKSITTPRFLFLTMAILIAAMSRLFPHIPNFTPIAAMALFGGAHFKDKVSAVLIPLIAMFISDCFIQLTTGTGFHITMFPVYFSITLITFIGMYVKRNMNVQSVMIGSLVSSVLFFMITNFAVWIAYNYDQGFNGLVSTYIMGIPFFAHTIAGDLFFNGILFGSFYFAQKRIPALIKA
ncbi:MAG TPA: hypothetical protein PK289_09615 [Bacteroidia bacterium]|jgi:hypothetical protein|nr:hypothetical protein [Bacteroidia bacterium]HRG51767.1 hypothetical protein [Bacteroidia bacterium]